MASSQLGNTANGSVKALPAQVVDMAGQPVQPVATVQQGRDINYQTLRNLGGKYKALFDRYAAERLPAEQRWLKNLRQYLGIYDPEIERQLPKNRSRAYPRVTRVKCVALLSRLMNLLFPGNEDNWDIEASPSPEMDPMAVGDAVEALIKKLQAADPENPPQLTQELIDEAVRDLARKNAAQLKLLLKDQLQEIGGSQIFDWIGLNRKVLDSGIKYGLGVLEGPYVRKIQTSGWALAAEGGYQPVEKEVYKPLYEHLPVWDFYPDMSAKKLPGEGYFIRKVMGRSELRKLGKRPDYLETQIKQVIANMPGGNYKAKAWENDLKTMGVSIQTQQSANQASGREKYEIIVFKGSISAQTLIEAGADIPEKFHADDVEAELWIVDNYIIKAQMNPWAKMEVDVATVHTFNFDEDDTSPIGPGLPQITRDSTLALAAATRMTLDNASITCGPNLEVNTSLMRSDQDITAIEPYKIWYRHDDGVSAQFPAVREININGHLNELQSLVEMFMQFSDLETFIGPQTGGDMQKVPSEAMRTVAGSSMLRGDVALPFKDIVRNYDTFTQSVIHSLVNFNLKFNPDDTPPGDYDIVARGATSLIAKEARGIQLDTLTQTLSEDDLDHINRRKLLEARMAVRDLTGMLVSEDEAERRATGRAQMAQEDRDRQARMIEAQIREVLSSSFKNITQGQKNTAAADAQSVNTAVDLLEAGMEDGAQQGNAGNSG